MEPDSWYLAFFLSGGHKSFLQQVNREKKDNVEDQLGGFSGQT